MGAMGNNDEITISYDEDGFEINITVKSNGNVLEDNKTLKEIVSIALKKYYTRFVGAIEPSNSNHNEWVFIFAKANYFDHDDMLARHPKAEVKINKVMSGAI